MCKKNIRQSVIQNWSEFVKLVAFSWNIYYFLLYNIWDLHERYLKKKYESLILL